MEDAVKDVVGVDKACQDPASALMLVITRKSPDEHEIDKISTENSVFLFFFL